MASIMSMPKLSDTMTEGVLLKWHKKQGEAVEAGEVIAEAESDKATMELEAFDAGILLKIVIPEGGKVAVGGTLAIIGDKGEDISALLASSETPAPQAAAPTAPAVMKSLASVTVPDPVSADEIITSDSVRIKASPLARKMAAERGILLRQMSGSGAGGRIIKRDLDTFVTKSPALADSLAAAATPGPSSEQTLNTMRAVIAQRMTLSKTTVPHFYLTIEVDMAKTFDLRQDFNAVQNEIKVSFTDIIVKATAMAMKNHPRVNGSFAGDKFILHGPVDIGLAVAVDDGLITPVIRNCDRKGLVEIAKESRALAEKAKERKLMPNEYSGATFTISNLGMYDIEEFSAIINPPEAAILAVAAIVDKPAVNDGQIVIGKRMKLTLSCDHRIVDGAAGALFLREVKNYLEHPIALLI